MGSKDVAANDTLFSLFPDGRLRNQRTGWCVRRVNCAGEKVYDLGPCDGPAVSIFNIWKARANQADLREFVGLPTVGVTDCNACGPYLLKQICGTKETNCGKEASAGWTKSQVHIVQGPEEKPFYISFAQSPMSLCGTYMQEIDSPVVGPNPVPPWYYFHKYMADGSPAPREAGAPPEA
jgi:hypothetical protein